MFYEIPLNGNSESFSVEIADKTYFFRVYFNHELDQWVLDLGTSNKNWIACNIALVTGQNLLMQYEHLNLGFSLWLQVDGLPEAEAGYENLGTEARLFAEVEDA